MTRRWMILTVLLMVALPSVLYGRWIKDKVYLQTDAVGKVEFSHYTHMALESVGKNCPTCHNDVFHIVTKKNPASTMAEMEDGKSCGFCHNGKKAFNVSGDCTTCHAGDVEINYGTSEKVVFAHSVHTEMFGCDDCHSDLFVAKRNANLVGMKKMEAGESCGACHDGDTAFGVSNDCGSCHQGAEDIAMQSSVGEIVFSHDAHTGMFGCDECHPDVFRAKANSNKVGMQKMEEGGSCGTCHDGDTAFGVKSDCSSCHQKATEIPIQSSVGEVVFSHDAHTEMLGCDECHPDIFQAKANTNQVGMRKMEAGESCGACHDGDTAFSVSGDCGSCHAGDFNYTEDVAIQSPVGEIAFSHVVHTEMFGCDECHPDTFKAKANSNQVGMQKMEAGASCGTCHDGDTAFGVKSDCGSCHQGAAEIAIQSTVGDIVFSHDVHMEMFGCDECHPDTFKPKANSNQVGMKKMETGESCGTCHDGDTAFGVKDDCSSCHQGAADIPMQSSVGEVVFSHDVHVEMLSCDECHPGTFKAEANSNQVGMQKMEDGASCGACHDGDTAFSVSEDCNSCHTGDFNYTKAVVIKSGVWDIVFSHESHTGMFGCDECHPGTFRAKANSNQVGMQKMEAGESCGACHDGDSAFSVSGDCTTCHSRSVDVAMQAKNVGTVPFSHSVHNGMFGCDECHPDTFKPKANSNQVGMQKMEGGDSCGACHDGDTAFSVKGDCATCHLGAVDMAIQSQSVGTVPFSHSVHTDMFGCGECHPDIFKAEANSNQVGMKQMESGASCGACHDGDAAFGVSGDCTTCHSNAIDMEIRTANVGKVSFSHSIHTEMFGCNECHPDTFRAKANSNQVGMKRMETGVSCGACHDGDTAFGVKEDCTLCHAGDVAFKSFGTTIFSHAAHNDMFACDECHPRIFRAQSGANSATMDEMEIGKSCGACHDGSKAFGVAGDCKPCHLN